MNKQSLKSVVISVFFSELTALILLALFAFLTYNKKDPEVYSSKLGVICLMLGSILCGVISSILTKRKTMVVPSVSGLVYCLLQIITSAILSNNTPDFSLITIKLVLTMGMCLIPSFLLLEKNGKKRKRAKRRKS